MLVINETSDVFISYNFVHWINNSYDISVYWKYDLKLSIWKKSVLNIIILLEDYL